MFKTIVESVLNEITAKDAYNKFYTKIPSDIFFDIVERYLGKRVQSDDEKSSLKFDNLLKFIFNSIVSGEDFREAYRFIEKYKKAKNEERIAFLNDFRSGKFTDIVDMTYRLEELEKNGVTTLSSFSKDGLIEVAKTDEWTLTCTTTYESNHHYFGNTKWCTASDRLGNYDGWLFFQKYIFDDMDYDPNGLEEIGEEGFEIDPDDEEDAERFAVKDVSEICCALVQFIKNDKSATYQAQIGQNGAIYVVCDQDDKKIEVNDFLTEIISYDIIHALIENGNSLILKTRAAFPKEDKYQESRNPYIRAKKLTLEKKKKEVLRELAPKVREKQAAKCEYVKKKFGELLNTNLLNNTSFIESICKNNKNLNFYCCHNKPEELSLGEKILQSQYYLYLSKIEKITEDICFLEFQQCLGSTLDVKNLTNGSMPTAENELLRDGRWEAKPDTGKLIVLAKCNTLTGNFTSYNPKIDDISFDLILYKRIINSKISFTPFRGGTYYDYNYNTPEAQKILSHYYFFILTSYGQTKDDDETLVFSLDTYKMITIEHNIKALTAIGENVYVLDYPYRSLCTRINTKTNQAGTFKCIFPEERYGGEPNYAKAFILRDSKKLHIIIPENNLDFYLNFMFKEEPDSYSIRWIEVYGPIVIIRGKFYGSCMLKYNTETNQIEEYDKETLIPCN